MSKGPARALRKIAEGKTKIIWSEETVLIESKDDITAGDGARRHVIDGKGALSTTTATNCFRLLERHGVATHFIETCSPTTFRARRCHMIPVEVVARRVATGSILKRYPLMCEGMQFLNEPHVELFLKDDARHDPFMTFDAANDEWFLHDPKKPLTDPPIDRFYPERFRFGGKNVNGAVAAAMSRTARLVFTVLEDAWAAQSITLVDLKIEFGFDAATEDLTVADVIDNDSWRIWPGFDKSKALDKQVYRDLAAVTPEALVAIGDNYARVASATMLF